MNNTIKILMIVLFGFGTATSHAFDIEDYATTYRATRDAYRFASSELRMAENDLITFIKANNTLLPMGISNYSKMGTGVSSCSFMKDCSEALTKTKKLALFDKVVADSTKFNNMIAAAGGSSTAIADLRDEIVDYHDAMDSTIHTDQQILFASQPATVVWDEDIINQLVNNGGSDPFGDNTVEQMTLYREKKDLYLKNLQEAKLARAAYMAAKAAYAEGFKRYYNNPICSNFMNWSIDVDTWLSKLGGL